MMKWDWWGHGKSRTLNFMAAHGAFGRIGLTRCRPGIGLPQKKDMYNALASDLRDSDGNRTGSEITAYLLLFVRRSCPTRLPSNCSRLWPCAIIRTVARQLSNQRGHTAATENAHRNRL